MSISETRRPSTSRIVVSIWRQTRPCGPVRTQLFFRNSGKSPKMMDGRTLPVTV
jgi:hypothetical protein